LFPDLVGFLYRVFFSFSDVRYRSEERELGPLMFLFPPQIFFFFRPPLSSIPCRFFGRAEPTTTAPPPLYTFLFFLFGSKNVLPQMILGFPVRWSKNLFFPANSCQPFLMVCRAICVFTLSVYPPRSSPQPRFSSFVPALHRPPLPSSYVESPLEVFSLLLGARCPHVNPSLFDPPSFLTPWTSVALFRLSVFQMLPLCFCPPPPLLNVAMAVSGLPPVTWDPR